MEKQQVPTRRDQPVLVKLNKAEREALDRLCEAEGRPRAQLVRRLIVRETRMADSVQSTAVA